MRNKQNLGFTLVELIIVIVILGILAVVALPRFINASSDANANVIKGLSAQLESVRILVFAKAIINNVDKLDRDPSPTTEVTGVRNNGVWIPTIFGTPWIAGANQLSNIMNLSFEDIGNADTSIQCTTDLDFCYGNYDGIVASSPGIPFTPGNIIVLSPKNYSVDDNCFAYYLFDRSDNTARTGYEISGC